MMTPMKTIALLALLCSMFATVAAEDESLRSDEKGWMTDEAKGTYEALHYGAKEVLENDATEMLCNPSYDKTLDYEDKDVLATVPNIPEWERCCRACIQEFRCLSWIHDSAAVSCIMLNNGGLPKLDAEGYTCGDLLATH